jgi:hypothetical protein
MERLLSQMRHLRIPAMAVALEQQWQTPNTYDELSFDERLNLLVEQEHLSRDNNRIRRCVSKLTYGFRPSLKT